MTSCESSRSQMRAVMQLATVVESDSNRWMLGTHQLSASMGSSKSSYRRRRILDPCQLSRSCPKLSCPSFYCGFWA